jgi:hypothetical protein
VPTDVAEPISIPPGFSNGEFIAVVTRLMDMFERERINLSAVEESRRKAELSAAELRGEIALERETRRRIEAELQELREMVEALGASKGGTALLASEEAASPRTTAPAGAGPQVASSIDRGHASEPEDSRPAEVDADGSDAIRGHAERPAAEDSTQGDRDANGETAEEEPPLPPGWRYATELPPPRKRWGLWGKDG